MTAANTYGRQLVIPLTNKSGGGVVAGDVVVVDTTNNDAFTTTTSANFTGGVGIAQETIASNVVGRVLVSGYAPLVNVNASVTRGHYGATFTVAKQATDAGASRGVGTFCQFLTGGTTPDAIMYPVDLLGSSLTNPMIAQDDMIIGGTAGAAARLAAAGAPSKFLQTDGSNHIVWGTAPAGGITHSTLGYTSLGASADSTLGWFLKTVTTVGAGLMSAICIGVKGDGTHGGSLAAYVLDDNAGSPGNVVAMTTIGSTSASLNAYLTSTARFISIPINFWAAASTAYWLVAMFPNVSTGYSILYDGSGSDKKLGTGVSWATDGSLESWTGTSNKYSIYCDILS